MYVNYSTIKESLLPSGDRRVRNYLHTYTSHSYYLRVVFISFVHKQHDDHWSIKIPKIALTSQLNCSVI